MSRLLSLLFFGGRRNKTIASISMKMALFKSSVSFVYRSSTMRPTAVAAPSVTYLYSKGYEIKYD